MCVFQIVSDLPQCFGTQVIEDFSGIINTQGIISKRRLVRCFFYYSCGTKIFSLIRQMEKPCSSRTMGF